MHFPLIQFLDHPYDPVDDAIDSSNFYDDYVVEANSDYISDPYDEEDRKKFIVEELPEMLKGVAIVDTEKETITFCSFEQIKKVLLKEFRRKMKVLRSETTENGAKRVAIFCGYLMRKLGREWNDYKALFNINDDTYEGQSFVEDVAFENAGKTFYIGGVLSLHY